MTLSPSGFPPGFEWDEAKDRENVRKHGIAFRDALRIFERPTLDVRDLRYDYGESRMISVGELDRRLVIVVVHTLRGENTRLISARRAEGFERARYRDHLRELAGERPRRRDR